MFFPTAKQEPQQNFRREPKGHSMLTDQQRADAVAKRIREGAERIYQAVELETPAVASHLRKHWDAVKNGDKPPDTEKAVAELIAWLETNGEQTLVRRRARWPGFLQLTKK